MLLLAALAHRVAHEQSAAAAICAANTAVQHDDTLKLRARTGAQIKQCAVYPELDHLKISTAAVAVRLPGLALA